ncbi:MAG: hypothetical protein ACI8W3_003730 [Myxococcota bacterium]|jgi:hypothetical protein
MQLTKWVPSRAAILLTTASLLGALSVGCAALPEQDTRAAVILDEGPLGGAALDQRKHDLDRAYRDMVHIHRTMQSLIDRKDGRALSELDRFVDRYMAVHLAPLLRSEWQSSHPELMAKDASLRFLEAEVLIQMRYPSRVQMVRDEIELRYRGQNELLIEYPIGKQGTLERGLEILATRKWKG